MRTCSKCKEIKPEENFHFRKDRNSLRGECKTCSHKHTYEWCKNNPDRVSEHQAKWHRNNLDKRKGIRLKRRYGISLEDYENILEKQNGTCAVCQEECSTGKKLAVDHCHETNKIRGLLCFNCNTALGRFKDSIKLLDSAKRYLEENK